ncbi:glycosyltransferase family 2 protein [Mycolicibacterium sp. CBM1]
MSSNEAGALRVLTVHYNTPELTSRLVRLFPRQTPGGRVITVHVLDNGSTPENRRALQAGLDGLPGVTLQLSDVNLGFGVGNNLLADRDDIDDRDVLWFLNSDTRPNAHCLRLLEEELDKGGFDVVSPLIFSGGGDDEAIWYCGGTISTRELRVRHQLHGARLEEAPERPFTTEFITGTSPMMQASTFRAVGGFPRHYFLYWEDTYLCWRAGQLGVRLGVVPAARLWHEVGGSSGSGRSTTFYYWTARNRFTFARDIGMSPRRLVVGRGGVESLRPLGWALLRERSERLRKARAVVRGTFDGLRQSQIQAAPGAEQVE